MMKSRFATLGILVILCVFTAFFTFSCGSSSDPTSSISQGKGMVSGVVTDGDGEPVPDAVIFLDGEPLTTTNDNGEFVVELDPGTYFLEARLDGETMWTLVITVVEGEEVDVDDDDDSGGDNSSDDDSSGSNGIGQCVSACVHETDMIGRECVALCKAGEYPPDEPEEPGGIGDDCDDDKPCGEGLECVFVEGDDLGTCEVEPGGIGDPCTTDDDCGEGLECVFEEGGDPPRTCRSTL